MANNKYKILIVEDDRSILSFVQTVLESSGFQVICAEKCQQGLLVFSSHTPDLVLLDLGLPDMDGTGFISRVREASSVPIVVLSARTDEADKVSALDMGADDYITKPFGTAELLARIRASLRSRSITPDSPMGVFKLGDFEMDYGKRTVTAAGNSIHFTQTEFNIVALLSRHCGQVLTYSTIIKEIWGGGDDGSVKKLQVNMANIRKKLGCSPGENRYFTNELGVGYRMFDEDEIR